MAVDDQHSASIAIGEDRIALADAARRFLTDQCPSSVVRRAVDDGERGVPPFHEDMAELGWLGLHVPEAVGGQGYGLAEAAVIAEELGRSVAPGPNLSTLATSTVLGIAVAAEDRGPATDWLTRLVSGEATGAIVRSPSLTATVESDGTVDGSGPTQRDGTIVVSGTTEATLCADQVDVLIVPVTSTVDADSGPAVDSGGVGESWWLVEAHEVVMEPAEPLDPTRSIATVHFDAVSLGPERRLTGVIRDLVDAVAATFVAAECAGLASWCVATAADHARHRQQFGRPIGAFQAVKHHCADMLVASEAIRGLAWDAAGAGDAALTARASDPSAPGEEPGTAEAEWALAADCAAGYALDAAVWVAETCIQVLGGIGFTWEHDAHLYLRRAVALRQQLGGGAPWRNRLARSAIGGVRRRLRVEVPDEAEHRRGEIRETADHLAELDSAAQRQRLVDLGWLVPHWPEPWGIDADAVTQLLIDAELRRAKVRRPHLQVGAWAAPTIAAHGTTEQQERWVRPTLEGTTSWCQLFSEPEAGSDLAGLRTRATKVDGGWSITGQKVWTTMAREAEWGICLVRTDPDAPKHAGITYVILDMKDPGIDIRPLREMTGLEMFNEVFFDDVFVPDDCVIGEVNDGWTLARTTLGNERVAMGSGSSFGGGIENLLGLVRKHHDDPGSVDPVTMDGLGTLIAEAHAVATLGTRSTLRSLTGARPGPEASIRKLLGVEHDQRVQEFGLGLLGPAGAAITGDAATWTFGFLANRCLTIAGGTSEIQRNVIGERLLGLPRDRGDR